MQQPAWLQHAWGELGTRETAGGADNPRILQYFRDVGQAGITHDTTPWCAAFAGACLERAGVASTRSLLARSYLDWGVPAAAEQLGTVVVLKRGSDPAAGHVGFLVGASGDDVLLVGGNQGDSVSVARFARTDVLGMRWAGDTGLEKAQPPPAIRDAAFDRALAHVLAMEGGYGDDPADPGGPTNFGLTLVDLAAARKTILDASTRPQLLAALKVISAEEVRAIYHERYWRPSQSGEMPAALGLMHFDASVNQGVGTAARLLQGSLGADVDGEIGPLTLAAAAAADPAIAVAAYAELRRKRYRGLAGFERFGRGWLNRVEATLARSVALIPGSDSVQKGTTKMPTTATANQDPAPQAPASDGAAEPKWWGQSMTVWGTLITAVATVAPVLGPLIGVDISAETVRQIGGQSADVVRGLMGLAGTIMAIYGRTRAAQPLVRRDFAVRL